MHGFTKWYILPHIPASSLYSFPSFNSPFITPPHSVYTFTLHPYITLSLFTPLPFTLHFHFTPSLFTPYLPLTLHSDFTPPLQFTFPTFSLSLSPLFFFPHFSPSLFLSHFPPHFSHYLCPFTLPLSTFPHFSSLNFFPPTFYPSFTFSLSLFS